MTVVVFAVRTNCTVKLPHAVKRYSTKPVERTTSLTHGKLVGATAKVSLTGSGIACVTAAMLVMRSTTTEL